MIWLIAHRVTSHETRHNDHCAYYADSILPAIYPQQCPSPEKLVVHRINPGYLKYAGRRRIQMASKYDP